MTTLAVLLVIVFLVLAFVVLSKVMSVAKSVGGGEDETSNPGGLWNNLNASLLLIFFVVGIAAATWSYFAIRDKFLPEAASEHGVRTDSMFWMSLGMATLAFFLTNFFLFYFAFKYRYNANRKATFYPVNHTLEYVWTAAPAVLMAGMVFFGWRLWTDITSKEPEDAIVVEIMGKQFNWYVRYSGKDDNKLGNYNYKLTDSNNEMGVDFSDEASFDDVQATELRLPKGRPVLLKIRARDVLHSVFLPYQRVKMDAVPGMPTKFWFVPTKTTEEMRYETGNAEFNFILACTEICGKGHFGMKINMVVEEEADFKKWLSEQKPLFTTAVGTDPSYLKRVPENLKAKAMKYVESAAPADSTTAATPTAVGTVGSASLR